MKKVILTAIVVFTSLCAIAKPARPGQFKIIKLADGKEIKVEKHGDEYVHFWEAEDGSCYIGDENTGYTLTSKKEIATQAMALRAEVTKKMKDAILNAGRPANKVNLGDFNHIPFTGTKKCLCILIEFKDVKFTCDIEMQKEQVNGIDYYESSTGQRGSVRDYFRKQSNGTFDIDFDVIGPYTASQNMSYYGGNDSRGNDKNASALIKEAINKADGDVNFRDYDWDGDGICEAIYVIYAGYGEADSHQDDTIWPHMSSVWMMKDGVYVYKYACGSELYYDGTLDGIGTMCHEYSHCLGLPDLYDVDYQCTTTITPDDWDIMASGSYNGDGRSPSNYSAWEKWYCGWLTPIELTEDVTIEGMGSTPETNVAYMIRNDGHSDEYYIIENRKKEGFDAALPGAGLLICHVDYNQDAFANNKVNCLSQSNLTKKPRYYFVRSKNQYTFPSSGMTTFSDFTDPQSIWYNANSQGKYTVGKPITSIRKDGDGNISFHFATQLTPTPKPDGAVFFESFNFCLGIGGNDGNFSVNSQGTFLGDNEGWTAKTLSGANQCVEVGSNKYSAGGEYITTPSITLEAGKDYELSFRFAQYGTLSKELTVSVEGNGELAETSFTPVEGQWVDCKTKLTGTGGVNIKFSRNRVFFLDEVLVMPSDPSGITEIFIAPSNGKVYNLSGQQVSPATKGIVVVNGKKFINK